LTKINIESEDEFGNISMVFAILEDL